jgi:hypothetical protein
MYLISQHFLLLEMMVFSCEVAENRVSKVSHTNDEGIYRIMYNFVGMAAVGSSC